MIALANCGGGPTFKTYTDSETGQTIIAGMGELHLEIIVTDCSVSSKSRLNVVSPGSYKETIREEALLITDMSVRPAVKAIRHVKIPLSLTSPVRATSFVIRHSAGAIPKEYIPAIDQVTRVR